MKFLLDQDVYATTAHFLKSQIHDVLLVKDIGLHGASDKELLEEARRQDRILVTRDRDFGGLVFVEKLGSGVIYLRVLPSTIESIHSELKEILSKYSEEDLKKSFIVVEPHSHRQRRI